MNFIDKLIRAGALLALTGLAVATVGLYFDVPASFRKARSMDSASPSYTCPMHAEILQDRPGDCPKCGMALAPAGQTEVRHGQCGVNGENHPGCCADKTVTDSATELRLPPGHPPVPGWPSDGTSESKTVAPSDATHSSH